MHGLILAQPHVHTYAINMIWVTLLSPSNFFYEDYKYNCVSSLAWKNAAPETESLIEVKKQVILPNMMVCNISFFFLS